MRCEPSIHADHLKSTLCPTASTQLRDNGSAISGKFEMKPSHHVIASVAKQSPPSLRKTTWGLLRRGACPEPAEATS